MPLIAQLYRFLIGLWLSIQPPYFGNPTHARPPPGSYHTSWIGNSFGGGGALPGEGVNFPGNGFGYWVQDNVGAIAVSNDGTVFDETEWDEGGRFLGLYKDGQPNRVPVIVRRRRIRTSNFGTSGTAVCVDGGFFYIANAYAHQVKPAAAWQFAHLLRFSWVPGDINSAKYINQVPLPGPVTALSCRNAKILVGYQNKIEIRDEAKLGLLTSYPVRDVSAALWSPDGSFWLIADDKVRRFTAGGDLGIALPGITKPTALAWSNDGRLIVTDNGPAQQVLFFDVSRRPLVMSTFGVKGGLYSGMPGQVAPQKLFGLRGVGMDAAGNLYVAMGFDDHPGGNSFIRAFSPAGALLWEVYATAFVDTFGFEPGSDGTVVFGRTTKWRLNLDRQAPGTEPALTAITVDPLTYPDDPRIAEADPRIHGEASVYPMRIDGTQLLYANGQYGGGYVIFAGSPNSEILHEVAAAPPVGTAWSVTDTGDIWVADATRRSIALYRLQSVTNGVPVYNWEHPRHWPWPADFSSVQKIIYNHATDSLYLFGFLNGQPVRDWEGVLGRSARRYDGWLAGTPRMIWTNAALPETIGVWRLAGKVQKTLLPAKDVSLAGDYLFFGMVRDLDARSDPRVNILDAGSGKYVGVMVAGAAVGNYGGWEDMVGSVHATERTDGEYLVLVEEDTHAKNLLFRWRPAAPSRP